MSGHVRGSVPVRPSEGGWWAEAEGWAEAGGSAEGGGLVEEGEGPVGGGQVEVEGGAVVEAGAGWESRIMEFESESDS